VLPIEAKLLKRLLGQMNIMSLEHISLVAGFSCGIITVEGEMIRSFFKLEVE